MHYVLGNPARQPHFYGRDATLQSLLGRSWTWVCAQRRIGKTSLLYRAALAARDSGCVSLFFDLAFLPRNKATSAELFRRFFIQHHRQNGVLAQLGLSLDDFANLEPAECFRELVELINQKGHSVMYLWDEAERLIDVENGEPGFLEQLRSQLHGLERFQYVIAATQIMASLYGRPSHVSSFVATFAWLPLAGLDDASATALLCCTNTGGWRTPLPADVIRAVLRYAGGHPLLLQEMGARLSELTSFDGRTANLELVAESAAYLAGNLNLRAIIKDDFARLTGSQRAVLLTLCDANQALTLSELCAEARLERDVADSAAYFLANYGYITYGAKLSLQYQFYRTLRPVAELPVALDSAQMERLLRQPHADPSAAWRPRGLTHAEVRQALAKRLATAVDFEAFCLDHFPEVKKRLTAGMDTTARYNLLLELAEPTEIMQRLEESYPKPK